MNVTFGKQGGDFNVSVFKPKESKGDPKDDSGDGDAAEMEKEPEMKQVTGIVHVSNGNCSVLRNQVMCKDNL